MVIQPIQVYIHELLTHKWRGIKTGVAELEARAVAGEVDEPWLSREE